MPNKLNPNRPRIQVRLDSKDDHVRLTDIVEALNKKFPGGNFNISSVLLPAVMAEIERREKELGLK